MGHGPLEPLLADPTVSDILVNGAQKVYIERHGKLELTEVRFNDDAHLMNIIENEGQRRAGLIWNRISYLIDLSVVAPMLGLLGTVLGMLEAFFVLPKESASVSSKALAYAIGGAMTATFFGLVVAIMAVVFHSIIKSRTLRALSEAEQVVHSIADYIKRGDA